MSASRTGAVSAPHKEKYENQFRSFADEWRVGWRPGLASIMGVALGYAVWMHLSSFFVEPLQQEFGWTRGQIALANSAGMITGFVAPFLGRIVDRIGAKSVAMVGLCASALCFLALSWLNGSLTYYYGVYFFLIMFGMATTGITYGRIIVGTFTRSRGTSLAMLRVGLAIAQATLPLLIYPVIARYGSSGGYLMLAGINALVTLPAIYFMVPGRKRAAGAANAAAVHGAPTSWKLLVRQPKILIVSLAATFHTAPLMAIMTQLKPLGMSVGLDSATAVGAVSALGIAPIIGALVAGLFVDRIWAPAVAFLMCVVSAAGCVMIVMLGAGISPAMFYVAIVLIGMGMGGESDVLGYMVARYFGLRDYATIAGIAALFVMIGIAVAASLIGRAYDMFGDYQIAMAVAAVVMMLSGIAYLMMGKYPSDPAA